MGSLGFSIQLLLRFFFPWDYSRGWKKIKKANSTHSCQFYPSRFGIVKLTHPEISFLSDPYGLVPDTGVKNDTLLYWLNV